MAKAKKAARLNVRCYLCGHRQEVSARTMSTTCPKCHKAIKVEDIVVKNYMPVNDVQTTGSIKITPRGRVAARIIKSGQNIVCDGSIEGAIETEGAVALGPKSSWKGKALRSKSLTIALGAKVQGHIDVPWDRDGAPA